MWADFNEQRDKTTNDPMEATFIGFRMWAQAVTQAGTTDVNAVRQAMYGQRVKAPSGFEVMMNTNHHLSKPAMIGKLNPAGTFDVVWRSINPIKASVWSSIFPRAQNLPPTGPSPGFAADAPSRPTRNGNRENCERLRYFPSPPPAAPRLAGGLSERRLLRGALGKQRL